MREQVLQVVQTYIDAVRRNDNNALPLHPDIVFESPLNRIQGIPAFEKGLKDFNALLKSIEVVHLTADDTTCAAALKIDTIFGLIHLLEFIHVVEGKIVSVRAYYDPRPILEGMARTQPA